MRRSQELFGLGATALAKVLAERPLAWIIPLQNPALAMLAPLRPRLDDAGLTVALVGHLARGNPLISVFKADPRAVILCLGQEGYVSPTMMGPRDQAPTWMYAGAVVQVEVSLFRDAEGLAAHLQDLSQAMESGREQPWRPEDMGERYQKLATGIVGFDAQILAVEDKLKLGQSEPPAIFQNICSALDREDRRPLADWMRAARQPQGFA